MRNSWYRFNVVEETIGWGAGTGAWFGVVYFGAVLLSERNPEASSLVLPALLLGLSLLIAVGHFAAMRFHLWGFRLYVASTAGLLLVYAVSGQAQSLSEGVIFWLHTGALPLHLFLFGLPKVRHLFAWKPSSSDSQFTVYEEEPVPPSVLVLLSTMPAGGLLFLLVRYTLG